MEYDVVNCVHDADDTVQDATKSVDVSENPLYIPTVILRVTELVDLAHSATVTVPGDTHLGADVVLATTVQK
jgi:hypothetical protein